MNMQLSELAALKLKLLISRERSSEPLAVRVIPLTSGCSSPSFALEITEILPGYETGTEKGVTFAWLPSESAWMDGVVIDLNRENGKFSVYYPNPPFMSDCQLDNRP